MDADGKYWNTRREKHNKISRIDHVNFAQGEVYYLCMLLHIVKCAKSFSDIRTVGGHEHPTFQEACQALGLLGDDQEWSHALTDSAQWASPYQLRQLFITLLLFSEVSDHLKLFTEHASHMSEDFSYRINRMSSSANNLSIENFITSLLFELEKLLKDAGYSLSHFNLPIHDHIGTASTENRLILDELTYDSHTLATSVEDDVLRLNTSQKLVLDAIYNSIFNNEGRTFFVYGYGGTDKTFLWTTLLNINRGQGKIALTVASSGIIALLLPGGRIPHSRFKIPLDIKQNSMCNVKTHTHLSKLIIQTSLIIWDEAPVNHSYCFEALDRTLRDILSDIILDAENRQFGGKTVVLGGDFHQTLPIIQNSTKQQILKACIANSYLWRHCEVLQLNENMRLDSRGLSTSDREELHIFAEWLLRVGSGVEPSIQISTDCGKKYIQILEPLLLPQEHRNLDGLISFVYNHGCETDNPSSYFSNRAILAPTNDIVATINNKMIEQLTSAQMSYYNSDCIDDSTTNHSTMEALYSTEFDPKHIVDQWAS
jgi:hypothetical protein